MYNELMARAVLLLLSLLCSAFAKLYIQYYMIICDATLMCALQACYIHVYVHSFQVVLIRSVIGLRRADCLVVCRVATPMTATIEALCSAACVESIAAAAVRSQCTAYVKLARASAAKR